MGEWVLDSRQKIIKNMYKTYQLTGAITTIRIVIHYIVACKQFHETKNL